jgi:hypothetical protein
MGSVSGDRMGCFCGDRVGRLICYTETRSLTNIPKTIIAITADSKNGHENGERGELCVESGERKNTF